MDGEVKNLLAELKSGLEKIYADRLKGVYLFGSYARGEADSESDVDVLVVLDRYDRYHAEIERTSRMVSDLCLKYSVSVSRIFVPHEKWLSHDSVFLQNVRDEAVAA
jgi:uncharacterized protein